MSAHSPTAAVRSQISSIVIRPARAGDAEAIARVRVDSWRETYRGMIPQSYLDAMKLEQSRALWEKVLTDFAVIVCRWQGRGPRAISKRLKENKQ